MIKNKKFTKVGVVGFGGYVPVNRIKTEELARGRGKDGKQMINGLGVEAKAVADTDEDTITLAVEAGKRAMLRGKIDKDELGAVLVGSESHPYAVKPSGVIVAKALGLEGNYITSDLEFACKAGTTGMIYGAAMIEAGLIDLALVIGSDVAQAKPGDVLEYSAGAGAGAIILGSQKYPWWASLDRVSSFNTDTSDFWRREGERYPSHGGRFTGEPGYFNHLVGGTKLFLKKIKQEVSDFERVVLHAPNGKFPKQAAKMLKISDEQMRLGWLVNKIGNPYSGASMLGLVAILEGAKKGEKVLVSSYGSGAGSDSIMLEIKQKLPEMYKGNRVDVASQLDKVEYLSYSEYLRKLEGR